VHTSKSSVLLNQFAKYAFHKCLGGSEVGGKDEDKERKEKTPPISGRGRGRG